MRSLILALICASAVGAAAPVPPRFDRSTPVLGDEALCECYRALGVRLVQAEPPRRGSADDPVLRRYDRVIPVMPVHGEEY